MSIFELGSTVHVLASKSIASLIRFVFWLPTANVTGGWKSCKNYVAKVIAWSRRTGGGDCREVDDWVWATFRDGFHKHVPIVRKFPTKIAIRVGHLEALALLADVSVAADRRDLAAYAMLFFTHLRIGHFFPEAGTPRCTAHMLRWRHISFEPHLHAPTSVFVYVGSAKNRHVNLGRPWWTSVGCNDVFPRFCPVRLLRLHFLLSYDGSPDGWIFAQPSGAPVLRRSFALALRDRLGRAAPHLGLTANDFDVATISGKSFRQGGLTALGATNVASHRLADAADHASVDTSRIYTQDDVADRASNTGHIAAASFMRLP
eukprot:SAG11_NODE_8147_length_1054_cov_7.388482_1_plen_317_part_00